MNGIDLAIIGIMLVSSGLGIWRGLTREALGLISWIGAGMAAYLLLPVARHFAQAYIHNVMIADAVAALVIFIAFLVFFSLISHIIASYVKDSPLGGIDRALGFGFGIARGSVILITLELALSSFIPRSQYPALLQGARFMPMVQSGSESMLAVLPKDAQEFIMQKQLKFVHDQAQKDLENHIESVLHDKVHEHIAAAMNPTPGQSQPQSAQSPEAGQPQNIPQEVTTPQQVTTAITPPLPVQMGATPTQGQNTQPQAQGNPAQAAAAQPQNVQKPAAPSEPTQQTPPNAKQELKPATKMDAQKTMESLANLRVKKAKETAEKQGYAKEHLSDMDRLIGTMQ